MFFKAFLAAVLLGCMVIFTFAAPVSTNPAHLYVSTRSNHGRYVTPVPAPDNVNIGSNGAQFRKPPGAAGVSGMDAGYILPHLQRRANPFFRHTASSGIFVDVPLSEAAATVAAPVKKLTGLRAFTKAIGTKLSALWQKLKALGKQPGDWTADGAEVARIVE